MALKIVKDSKFSPLEAVQREAYINVRFSPATAKTSGRELTRICTNKQWARPKAAPIALQIPNTKYRIAAG